MGHGSRHARSGTATGTRGDTTGWGRSLVVAVVLALVATMIGNGTAPRAVADEPGGGGTVTGTVTDDLGVPLGQVCVTAYEVHDWGRSWVTSTHTDGLADDLEVGEYRIEVPAGDVALRFEDCGGRELATIWHGGVYDPGQLTPITVGSGDTVSGVDVALELGGTVTGTTSQPVDDTSEGATVGAPDVCVSAWVGDQQVAGVWSSGSEGEYTLNGLPPVPMLLEFRDCGGRGLLTVWWEQASTRHDATPVEVASGGELDGIDVVLPRGASIAGTTTDEDGVSLEDMCVQAVDEHDAWLGSATTDEDGAFEIGGLAAGTVYLRAEPCDTAGSPLMRTWAPDAASRDDATPLVLDAGETVTDVTITVLTGGTISGTVLLDGPDGPQPAPDLCVEAEGWTSWASTTTDADGAYELVGLAGPDYRVRVLNCPGEETSIVAQWWDGVVSYSDATPIEVEPGLAVTDVDFLVTEAASISGTVRGEGTEPGTAGPTLPDMCVRVEGVDGASWWGMTDANGVYTVEGLPGGDFRVRADDCGEREVLARYHPSERHQDDASTVTVAAGDHVPDVDVVLPPAGSISGTIDVEPAGDGEACLSARGDEGSGFTVVQVPGEYRVGGLEAGTYELEAFECGDGDLLSTWYPGTSDPNEAATIDVGPGANVTGRDLTMQVGGRIVGQVTAADGSEVVGFCATASPQAHQRSRTGALEDDGSFVVPQLHPGDHELRFHPCGYSDEPHSNLVSMWWGGHLEPPGDVVTVEAGTAVTADQELPVGGEIEGTVVDPDGTGATEVCVQAGRAGGFGHADARTDEDGAYVLSGLPTGTYEVWVHECGGRDRYLPGGGTAIDDIEVVQGGRTSVDDIQLAQGGAIAGSLSLADDAASGRVCVSAYDSQEQPEGYRCPMVPGEYRFGSLPPGDYLVGFRSDATWEWLGWYDGADSEEAATPVTVVAGATTDGIDATLDPDAGTPPPEGPTVTFTGSPLIDPDVPHQVDFEVVGDDGAGGAVTLGFDPGDGSPGQSHTADSGESWQLSHTYSEPGRSTATATVTDASGNVTSRSLLVRSANRPPEPTLDAVPETGSVPLDVAFSVGATDPDGDPMTYVLDPGDGTEPVTGSIPTGEVLHTYEAPGTFTATLTVSDGLAEASVDAEVVVQDASTTTLTSDPDPSVTGQTFTLTATVTAADPSTGQPQGTVEFRDADGSLVGTDEVDATSGSASISLAQGAGDAEFTATYLGSDAHAGSDSGTHTHVVERAETRTELTVRGETTIDAGETFTFDVEVEPVAPGAGTPVGTVQLLGSDESLGTSTSLDDDAGWTMLADAELSDGALTFQDVSLPPGQHQILARYVDDAIDFAGSDSEAQGVVVRWPTTITLLPPDPAGVTGQAVEIEVVVTSDGPAQVEGEATIEIDDGSPVTVPLEEEQGTASITWPRAGELGLAGAFAGDDTRMAASTTMTVEVDRAATEVEVAVLPDPVDPGDDVELEVDVRVLDPGGGTPAGTLDVLGDGLELRSIPLEHGAVTVDVGTFPSGVTEIDVNYTGSPDHAGTGTTVPIEVRWPTTVDLEVTPSPSTVGEETTITATVDTDGPASPSGVVEFRLDGDHLDAIDVGADSVASTTFTFDGEGDVEVVADYLGDDAHVPSTAMRSHTVDPPLIEGLQVQVVDADTDEPVSAADALLFAPDGTQYRAASGPDGIAVLEGVPDGSYTVYVLADGYVPDIVEAEVFGGAGEVQIALTAGELAATDVTVEQVDPNEVDGLDVDDPENYLAFEYEANLWFGGGSSGTSGYIWGRSSSGSGGSGGTGGGGTLGSVRIGDRIGFPSVHLVDDQPVVQWLIVPISGSFAREFFEVELLVQNLAPPDFTLADQVATLELPDGLAFPQLYGDPQPPTRTLPDIVGQDNATASWIIRGDEPGEYDLTAHVDGFLRFGEVDPDAFPFTLLAETDESFRVWGPDAVRLLIRADEEARDRYPYGLQVGFENVADIPVYNVRGRVSQEGAENLLFQPLQRTEFAQARLDPGQTLWSPGIVVIPEADGDLDLSRSFVREVAGDVGLAVELSSQPRELPFAEVPELTVTSAPEAVALEWEAVDGAEGYQVFTTADRDTPFGTQAAASTQPGVTEVELAFDEGEERWFVVSTLLDGVWTLVHPMEEGTAGAKEPDPEPGPDPGDPGDEGPPPDQGSAIDEDIVCLASAGVARLAGDASGTIATHTARTASVLHEPVDGFPDVADGSTHSEAIAWMGQRGFARGFTDGTFGPARELSRQQLASFAALVLGVAPVAPTGFEDVHSDVHGPNIGGLAAQDIVLGCDDDRFCPEQSVTRAQAASILARALELPPAERDWFIDDDGTTHEDSINRIADAGITVGCAEDRFCPSEALTRAQMASLLYRAFGDALEPRIADGTHVLSEHQDGGALRDYQPASGRIVVDLTVAADWSVGDVVVAGPLPEAPHGFLRSITAIAPQGGQVVLTTEQAVLTEVIEEGAFSGQIVLSTDDIVDFEPSLDGVELVGTDGVTLAGADLAAESRLSQGWTMEPLVLYDEDGDLTTTDDQIRIMAEAEAALVLETAFRSRWTWTGPRLEEFAFIVGNEFGARIELDAQARERIGAETSIGRITFSAITFFVAGVPVVIVPELELIVGADGSIEAKVEMESTLDQTSRAGARWTDWGGWDPVMTNDLEFVPPQPVFHGDANARVYAGPRVTSRLYGLTGPSVDGLAHLRGEASVTPSPLDGELEFDWGLYGGLESNFAYDADIPLVDFDLSYERRLFDREWLLLGPEDAVC